MRMLELSVLARPHEVGAWVKSSLRPVRHEKKSQRLNHHGNYDEIVRRHHGRAGALETHKANVATDESAGGTQLGASLILGKAFHETIVIARRHCQGRRRRRG